MMKSHLFERLLRESNTEKAAIVLVSKLEKRKEIIYNKDRTEFVEFIKTVLEQTGDAIIDKFKDFCATCDLTGSCNDGTQIAVSLIREIYDRVKDLIDQGSIYWNLKDLDGIKYIYQDVMNNTNGIKIELAKIIDNLNKSLQNKELLSSSERLDWAIKHGYSM